MKVNICRNMGGSYEIYTEKAKGLHLCSDRDYWDATTGSILNYLCSRDFKKYTGLKKHLKPGTKQLMEWTPPLSGQQIGEAADVIDGLSAAKDALVERAKQLEGLNAELVEALQGILDNYKMNNGKGLGLGPVLRAKEAIAKAEGKS